jgi:hypothetical protein
MTMLPPRGRRRTLFAVIGLAAAALLWSGYWSATSRLASAAIERATAAVAAGGDVIGCDGDALGGFPLRLDLSCQHATFHGPGEEMSAAIDMVAASAPLYRPGHVEATAGGPFVFDAPGRGIALSATWKRATADVDAGIRGVKRAALELDGLKVVRTGDSAHVPFIGLGADRARFAATPAADGAYDFASLADGMQLVQRPNQNLPPFDTEARITALNFGPALGSDPSRTFATWLAGGGAMRVDQLSFTIGRTSIAANGTLSISKEGLLSGVLTLRFAGLDALPDLADQVQPGSRKDVSNAVVAITAVTLPVPGGADGPARQTVLFIRDGFVSVGLIPIGKIPPISF